MVPTGKFWEFHIIFHKSVEKLSPIINVWGYSATGVSGASVLGCTGWSPFNAKSCSLAMVDLCATRFFILRPKHYCLMADDFATDFVYLKMFRVYL